MTDNAMYADGAICKTCGASMPGKHQPSMFDPDGRGDAGHKMPLLKQLFYSTTGWFIIDAAGEIPGHESVMGLQLGIKKMYEQGYHLVAADAHGSYFFERGR